MRRLAPLLLALPLAACQTTGAGLTSQIDRLPVYADLTCEQLAEANREAVKGWHGADAAERGEQVGVTLLTFFASVPTLGLGGLAVASGYTASNQDPRLTYRQIHDDTALLHAIHCSDIKKASTHE